MSRTFLFLLLAASLVLAQDYRATVTGQVSDPTGSPIPNALVKAVKEGTNETKEVRTNNNGFYTLNYLDPGRYSFEISASGFSTLTRTGIVLLTADKLNLTVSLELGQVNQSITVVGEQELITTTTAARGLNFDPIKVAEYPLNGRQSYMLLALTPGVLFTQRTFGNTGFSGTRAWDVNGSYTMNGGRTGTNQFLLNGAPISSDGTWNVAINVEAIQEFKVMVNTYDAQYGRSGGGHVNTTMKSGTNGWHGSVFDFWRNAVLDANSTQNNRQGAGRGKRNQHQFGGVLGGPIRKDKDFFLFSFEGWRERVPFPTVTSTPPAGMRAGGGYTEFQQGIFDPLTSKLCEPADNCTAGGLYRRQPFPGNVVPASRISPIGRNILNLYPLPNQVGTATINQNYFGTGNTGVYRYEQPSARYDKVISQNDRLYGLFSFQDGSEFRNQNGFDPPARTGNMTSTRTNYLYVADWTRVLNPRMVLDVRASFNHFWQNFPDVSDFDYTYDKLGIKKVPQVDTFPSRLAPRVTVSDYNDILGNQFLNRSSRSQIDFSAGLSHTKGSHSMKYGYEWATIIRGAQNSGRPTGAISFDRLWTRQYSGRGLGNQDGNAVAALLLGLPSSGSIDYNDTFLRREPYMGWYFQDDWKLNKRLTLNLGLRYDIQFPVYEIHDRLIGGFDYNVKNSMSDPVLAQWRKLKAEFDATNPRYRYPDVPDTLRGGLLFAGVDNQPRRIYDWDLTNIQPRVGFAYNFLHKTVMRGGVGIFHRTSTQGGVTTGFSQSTPYINSLDGGRFPSAGLTGPYSLEDPWPTGVVPPTGSSQGLLTNIGRGVSFDIRKRLVPRTYQYSYGLERELPWDMVFEISYVGSVTNKEPVTLQMSDASPAMFTRAQQDPNFFNNPVPNPFFGILPAVGQGAAPTINARELYRRIPLFPGVSQQQEALGRVWYHGVQIRFEKRAFTNRVAGSLTWVLSYTFAKQLENSLRNNNHFEDERFINQLADIDRPQQFSWSGVWDLPFGKARHFKIQNNVLNTIFGDWNYNWILTYYGGPPTPKPDAVFGCESYIVSDQSPNRWFENRRGCYTQRAPFTFRDVESRFAWIRDPALPQLNITLAKRFRFGERYELELRGESFNFTNTPLLRGPNTSFTDPLFGTLPIQQDNFPRNIQIGARIKF
ncbi:MAG: TonB-dependent receptor [Acidobacteria bacterium]|nr:TonB-dependent receptor [Acidobacteriota bacterium]